MPFWAKQIPYLEGGVRQKGLNFFYLPRAIFAMPGAPWAKALPSLTLDFRGGG